MRHVYRRPFDYAVPRRYFDIYLAVSQIEAQAASATFSTYQATVTSSVESTTIASPSGSRFTSPGFYRKRWNYAQINARIDLIYVEESFVVEGYTGSAAFETYEATVNLGAASATGIAAEAESVGFTTYISEIDAGRDDPLADGIGSFVTYECTVSGTYGLGVSRSGPTQVKSAGTYMAGTVRGSSRRPIHSITNQLTRRK